MSSMLKKYVINYQVKQVAAKWPDKNETDFENGKIQPSRLQDQKCLHDIFGLKSILDDH